MKSHNYKETERTGGYTWGTHCCRVRVHVKGVFSPAATSIMSSLELQKGEINMLFCLINMKRKILIVVKKKRERERSGGVFISN